ncbi:glycosyltransferase [Mycobacterium phage Tweety]|uniref:Glycosyltransferase n=3 Tax=Cheoctovirus TaxID=1623281 RepID=A0A0K1Y7G2_9CAUD|nr:glycosyltransferase [Mycobacterium phage Tweety]YP_009016993.1 glycosyltransferase [Mycobacterium phage DeadP]YP_009212743.1 glycosyltransferase [Mycobacterium phage Dante]ABQ86173.1 glycosyltransferase [Mycobacterium phage Tweety]AER47845.1 glycosyltransferase [Mycobacterium phage DeadP]AKY03012.1 glycosyltransferase [Mycobacterium phage Dante]
MDITIGTGVWGDYGKFLPDWAASLAAQTVKPTAVVIVDAGLDDPCTAVHAVRILEAADIPATVKQVEYDSVGGVRNAPFWDVHTEWAMSLDADDTLVPDAIETYAALQDDADVIAPGAIRNGEPELYPHASTEAVLQARHCVLSCGPFRMSFWRQRPWQTKNPWVDSVFWIGLAHLGARIVPAPKPTFVYRRHEGSMNTWWNDQQKLQARRQMKQQARKWTLTD